MFTNLNLDGSLLKQIQSILDNKNADNLPKVFIEAAHKAKEASRLCVCAEERTDILRKYFKEAESKFDGKINENVIRGFQNYFDSISRSTNGKK